MLLIPLAPLGGWCKRRAALPVIVLICKIQHTLTVVLPERFFFERAAAAQKEFNTAPYRAIFADCLTEIGPVNKRTFRDTLGLRIAPPVKTHEGGFRSNVAIHAILGGSGLQAQINWWLPVWPLTKERTMGFYPLMAKNRLPTPPRSGLLRSFWRPQKSRPGKAAAYPSAPCALVAPDGEVYPVLPPVGYNAGFFFGTLARFYSQSHGVNPFFH